MGLFFAEVGLVWWDDGGMGHIGFAGYLHFPLSAHSIIVAGVCLTQGGNTVSPVSPLDLFHLIK